MLRKVFLNGKELESKHVPAIIGSGVLGALAYTFSDTFWFSAVEGELYALSSLIIALVFWGMLKWEEEADKPYSGRWIILIAYIMGLGLGCSSSESSDYSGSVLFTISGNMKSQQKE